MRGGEFGLRLSIWVRGLVYIAIAIALAILTVFRLISKITLKNNQLTLMLSGEHQGGREELLLLRLMMLIYLLLLVG